MDVSPLFLGVYFEMPLYIVATHTLHSFDYVSEKVYIFHVLSIGGSRIFALVSGSHKYEDDIQSIERHFLSHVVCCFVLLIAEQH